MAGSGYIILTLRFWEEEDEWVGLCEELGTAAQGRSLDEAMDVLTDLVELDLNTLEDMGERERFFKKHGIEFYEQEPAPKRERVELQHGELAKRQLFPVGCN